MICGTMVFEDMAIQWNLNPTSGKVMYTACDVPTGEEETISCSLAEFGAAMALAIGSDEIAGADVLYPLAEAAMPSAWALRWIP